MTQDRDAFVAAVREHAPADADEFGRIAEALIAWSVQHDWALQHAPAERQVQAVVKFAVQGMNAPFWTAYPREADGAKLSVVDSDSVFPDSVVTEARQVLAELDGRAPKPNERPTVSFSRLRSADAVRRVKQLLCRLLVDMGRHAEPVSR